MGRKGLEESHSLANTIGGFSNLRLSRTIAASLQRGPYFLIGQISPEFVYTRPLPSRHSSPVRPFGASPTRDIGLVKIPGGNEIEISGL